MKVLIIGDACKDVYIYGRCEWMCPDAPVPVFVPTVGRENGGMAKNVFANLASLNIDCHIICNEEEISKTRYVDNKTNHLFLRVDSNEEHIKRIERKKLKNLQKYEIVVISDYDKGFLTAADIKYICENHPLVFVDTKKKLGPWCLNSKFIKINEVESELASQYIADNTEELQKKLIVTRSARGCDYNSTNYEVKKVNVKDASGAGDTFMAGLVAEYLRTKDINKAIIYANKCATKVVQERGVNLVGRV